MNDTNMHANDIYPPTTRRDIIHAAMLCLNEGRSLEYVNRQFERLGVELVTEAEIKAHGAAIG